MFIELTNDNLDIINNTFIDKKTVRKDLDTNPFAKYILLKEEEVIAYIYYSYIYDRCEINQIEVLKEKRNLGYGTKILKYLTEKVEMPITLEVNKENTPAIKLYRKLGFKDVAIRKGYYNGVDGILMERTSN
jgi:acetyltransferase, GNAT family protein